MYVCLPDSSPGLRMTSALALTLSILFFRHAELCPSPQGRGEEFSLSLGHAALLRSLLLMALGQPPLSSADRAAWAPCPPDSPGRVGVCGLIDTFFFLPIICEACVESERGGGNAPHVRGQPTPR